MKNPFEEIVDNIVDIRDASQRAPRTYAMKLELTADAWRALLNALNASLVENPPNDPNPDMEFDTYCELEDEVACRIATLIEEIC